MAIAYGETKSLNRSKGDSSIGKAAYINRAKYEVSGNEKYDFSKYKKKEVVVAFGMDCNGREYTKEKCMELWNDAENADVKSNASTARSAIYALPFELSQNECISVAKNFAKYIAENHKMFCNLAIHFDKGNPHLHLLTSTREFNGIEFGVKNRTWSQKQTSSSILRGIRKYWQDECNKFLTSENQIDMRSYKAQGIDKIGTIHIGRNRTIENQEDVIQQNNEITNYNEGISNAEIINGEEEKSTTKLLMEKYGYSKDEVVVTEPSKETLQQPQETQPQLLKESIKPEPVDSEKPTKPEPPYNEKSLAKYRSQLLEQAKQDGLSNDERFVLSTKLKREHAKLLQEQKQPSFRM